MMDYVLCKLRRYKIIKTKSVVIWWTTNYVSVDGTFLHELDVGGTYHILSYVNSIKTDVSLSETLTGGRINCYRVRRHYFTDA